MDNAQPTLTKKENFFQMLKFGLFSASAGIIEVAVFTLMQLIFRDAGSKYGPSYFIALAASVLWNFTFNRKFTFQSAGNVPRAMLLVFCYYLAFTPLSVWWGTALARGRSTLAEYLVLGGTMLVNLVTEYLWQRFVVFRKSMNTNDLAKKKRGKEGGRNAGHAPVRDAQPVFLQHADGADQGCDCGRGIRRVP